MYATGAPVGGSDVADDLVPPPPPLVHAAATVTTARTARRFVNAIPQHGSDHGALRRDPGATSHRLVLGTPHVPHRYMSVPRPTEAAPSPTRPLGLWERSTAPCDGHRSENG